MVVHHDGTLRGERKKKVTFLRWLPGLSIINQYILLVAQRKKSLDEFRRDQQLELVNVSFSHRKNVLDGLGRRLPRDQLIESRGNK